VHVVNRNENDDFFVEAPMPQMIGNNDQIELVGQAFNSDIAQESPARQESERRARTG